MHQDNRGVAAATNAGAAEARFALLAGCDHDDVVLPDRLALQVAFMAKHEDIAVIGGGMRYIDGEGKLTGATYSPRLTPEACHEALVDAVIGPLANPTAMVRKAAFDKIGGYRQQFKYAGDLDLWLRMDEQFKLSNLPDILVDYRKHGGNMTVRHRFHQALHSHIARQAAFMRRRGLPDPADGWTTLDLDNLAVFAMPDEEKTRVYRELFDAALSTFAKTKDEACLHLAHRYLTMVPTEVAV
jgi:GT2 family glycosyltransferase